MKNDSQNKKISNSETIPFNISRFSTLKYIKVIFTDANKELREIQTTVNSINNDTIQLYTNIRIKTDITCPTGIVLKFVTIDAIYFAKTILKDIIKTNDKLLFIINTPQKTIRQQNREFFRINIERPCVLRINDDKNNNPTYIAQTVNLSKGGVLINNTESILNDKPIRLQLYNDSCCHIVIFLEHDLKIKSYAKFIRSECINDSYRYAFQFLHTTQKYIIPFDKYITNEEFKLLQSIKNN